MRAPPTTFECVEFTALREPGRIALVEDGQEWSYGHIYRNLVRFTRLLHSMGVARGQRVAVSRPSLQIQLLLLIACENLGAVTSPFAGEGDTDAQALFALVDWVFSEVPQTCPPGVQFRFVDQAFIAQVARIDADGSTPYPRVSADFHEPQRISRTSGSSGHSRFMLMTRHCQEQWVRLAMDTGAYTSESRLLLHGPLVMNSAYTRACACLRLGAAVLSVPDGQAAVTSFTHLWGLPLALATLLDAFPPGYRAAVPVRVNSTGGFVTAVLRGRIAQAFGSEVISGYGANEAGGVCPDLDLQGTGLLWAGADVRIVDTQGHELPQGQGGMIVTRTPCMTDGYLGDAQASQEAFRDGWFHTGDWGALVGPRRLRVDGRHDDLINAGGLKVPAVRIEARIRALAGVQDCAVLSANFAGEGATIGIALELQAGADREMVLAQLKKALVLGADASAQVMFVDALPRLSEGKLDRLALRRLFRPRS